MSDQPKAFVRLDDGERFTLNDNETYSNEYMKTHYPDNLHIEWTLEVMLKLSQSRPPKFKIEAS